MDLRPVAAVRQTGDQLMRVRLLLVSALGLLGLGCGKPSVPEFHLYSLDGKQAFSVNDYRGKVLVMDFWATWCMPCRQFQPLMREAAGEYAKKGVVVFGVTDEDPDKVTKFVAQRPLGYPAVIDRGDQVATIFSIKGFPSVVIIDQHGAMAYPEMEPDITKVRAVLDKLVGKP